LLFAGEATHSSYYSMSMEPSNQAGRKLKELLNFINKYKCKKLVLAYILSDFTALGA
jgi:hypothetical protein